MEKAFLEQVKDGERFEFGANWKAFLNTLDAEKIEEAKKSLVKMLDIVQTTPMSFLDIGSGSGLFSLAARSLGFNVFSFDFDKNSVECTRTLQTKYFKNDPDWTVQEGSALDKLYINSLGQFDIVYSWGVLHHTGQMWNALENACIPVKQGGKLFIAIYNDQQFRSRIWLWIKKAYNKNSFGKFMVKTTMIPYFALLYFTYDLIHLKNPVRRYVEYKKSRGMSMMTDWIDWIGGYPFEVASVKAITEFYEQRGFSILKVAPNKSHGCNEFVFIKNP